MGLELLISYIPDTMPFDEARIMCSVEAGHRYELDPAIIYAVALNEGGSPDSVRKNTNGTEDLGIMQFNTAYLKELSDFGITKADVQAKTCYPFHLAAWRIKQHIEEDSNNDLLTKISNYHSRTPKFNQIYKKRLIENLKLFNTKRAIAAKYEKLLKIRAFKLAKIKEQIALKKAQQEAQKIIKNKDLAVIPAFDELLAKVSVQNEI